MPVAKSRPGRWITPRPKPRLDFNLYGTESSSQVLSRPDSAHQHHDSSTDTHLITNLQTTHDAPHTRIFHSLIAFTTPHRLLPLSLSCIRPRHPSTASRSTRPSSEWPQITSPRLFVKIPVARIPSSPHGLKDGRRGTELSNMEVHTVSSLLHPSLLWRGAQLRLRAACPTSICASARYAHATPVLIHHLDVLEIREMLKILQRVSFTAFDLEGTSTAAPNEALTA